MSQNGRFSENTDQGYEKKLKTLTRVMEKNWKHWPGLRKKLKKLTRVMKKTENTDQGYENTDQGYEKHWPGLWKTLTRVMSRVLKHPDQGYEKPDQGYEKHWFNSLKHWHDCSPCRCFLHMSCQVFFCAIICYY